MTEIGPLEYVVVGFDGNQFTGEITPALMDLVDKGFIRIIDLAVVSKDADGHVTTLEANELGVRAARQLARIDGEHTGLLSEADLMLVAAAMADNTTAAAMLFEHVWATRFAVAVRKAHGRLVASTRIPHDVVVAAQRSLAAVAGKGKAKGASVSAKRKRK